MQALISRSIDQPLKWAELPDRPLRPDEVRVEVRAVGVNPVDWKMREASLLGIAQRIAGPTGPFVCGVDFAGVVRELGAAVTDLRIGDHVVGGTDFSRRQRGSYARTVQVRADQVAVLPKAVAFAEAACLPVAGVTAQMAIVELGRLDHKPGGRALVLGGSGGVGHFAIQLARLHGGSAVAVCSAKNLAFAERLGGIGIDYGAGDPLSAAQARGPFDVIVDGIGSATYPVARCLTLLGERGVHVLVVPQPRDYLRLIFSSRLRTVLGRPVRKNLSPLVAALADGRLRVEIAERIPLDQAERAHQTSRAGHVVGKLVLVA